MTQRTNSAWEKSEKRKALFDAADRAGKIFERGVQERREYEFRKATESISSS